jgi:hypothetical protein
MGAHVIGPGPKWSEDGIPAYNVLDAMCEDVLHPNPKLPSEVKTRPALRDNKTLDEAKKAWLTQSKDAVRGYTDQWKNVFGWKAKLVGDQPDHLLDNLNDFYLYVPMSTT